jgi:hypothetical protein
VITRIFIFGIREGIIIPRNIRGANLLIWGTKRAVAIAIGTIIIVKQAVVK